MAILDEIVPPLLKAVQQELSVREAAVPIEELSGFALLSGIAGELLTSDRASEPQPIEMLRADAERSYELAVRAMRRKRSQS